MLVALLQPAVADKLSLNQISAVSERAEVGHRVASPRSTMTGRFRPARSISSGPVGCGSNTIRQNERWSWPVAVRWRSLTASRTSRPNSYPLSRTPLNLILERNVNLAARTWSSGISMTAPRPRSRRRTPNTPNTATIALVFSGRAGRAAAVDHHRGGRQQNHGDSRRHWTKAAACPRRCSTSRFEVGNSAAVKPAAAPAQAAASYRSRDRSCDSVRDPQQPGLCIVASAQIAGLAFVIGKILVARVAQRNAGPLFGLVSCTSP